MSTEHERRLAELMASNPRLTGDKPKMDMGFPFPRYFDWGFASTFQDRPRKDALRAQANFEDIGLQIYEEASQASIDLKFERVKPQKGATGPLDNCSRPRFTFKVSPRTFDAFFNSASGYRAQYLIHPELGQAANCILIAALSPLLLRRFDQEVDPDMTRENVERSLAAASAKIWPVEAEISFEPAVLTVERWLTESQRGNDPERKAEKGLAIPDGTSLRVFGAWIDEHGSERVVSSKIERRLELHRKGHS